MNDSPEPPKPSIDLPEWLGSVLALDHDADALQFEGVWYRWGWLAAGVEALDDLLSVRSFGVGTKVGVLVRNRPEIVRTIAGTLTTRRCLVTLSSAIPSVKLAAELTSMRLPVVIASEADWDDQHLRDAVRSAGSLGIAVSSGSPASRSWSTCPTVRSRTAISHRVSPSRC